MKDSKNYVLITTSQADMSENHDERFKYRDKMPRTSGFHHKKSGSYRFDNFLPRKERDSNP